MWHARGGLTHTLHPRSPLSLSQTKASLTHSREDNHG